MKLKLFSSASVNMGFPKVSGDLDAFVDLIKLGDYSYIYIQDHEVADALKEIQGSYDCKWEEEHEIELKGLPEPPVNNIKPYETPGYENNLTQFTWTQGPWTTVGYSWTVFPLGTTLG